MTLDPIAKILIIIGSILVTVGIAWQLGWIQQLRLGRLPGDIYIEKENMRVYIPLTTGILLSIVFTFLSQFFRK